MRRRVRAAKPAASRTSPSPNDHTENPLRGASEGHSDADFTPALRNLICEHAVEPDAGEKERDAGEDQASTIGVRRSTSDSSMRCSIVRTPYSGSSGSMSRELTPDERCQRFGIA